MDSCLLLRNYVFFSSYWQGTSPIRTQAVTEIITRGTYGLSQKGGGASDPSNKRISELFPDMSTHWPLPCILFPEEQLFVLLYYSRISYDVDIQLCSCTENIDYERHFIPSNCCLSLPSKTDYVEGV